MRSLGSVSRDCHSGDCWLTKNVRDERMGRGSGAAAVDVSSWSEWALLLAVEVSVRVSFRKTKALSDERVVRRRLRSGCE